MLKAQHILLLVVLFYVLPAPAQNIGGVVNSYYKVIDVIPAKACVIVSNAAGLAQYDNAMLVQMKGASVSTTNDNTFGTVTSLNDAGNYELGYICKIKGDSVFFMHTLKNTYTVSGKVQLVKVPEYSSATVTTPLIPAPWNNTAGTGGVLAIIVDNTLTLNENIAADTMGFKGGASKVLNGTCGSLVQFTNYSYNTAGGSTGGGYKGEGIVDLAANMNGGRGPAANGGGGGNDHNNGAGGGGNLVVGGNGGQNNSTTGCNNKYPGLAGRALNSNGGNKIYLGGGGGNGHGNNTLTMYGGGAGGGIVFIKADAIVGNNYTVSAKGQTGAATIGDGSSGGGAGGTIIMDVTNYIGTTNVFADGGSGGNIDNLGTGSPNRSMGPGGGGSGGVLYFTGTAPGGINFVNGGIPGYSDNTSPVGLAGFNGAGYGSVGSIVENYTVSRSVIPAAYCSNLLLPLSLLYFDGYKQGDHALLSWTVTGTDLIQLFTIEYATDGNTWNRLEDVYITDIHATKFKQLTLLPPAPVNYYRLKITGKNNQVTYSKVIVIKNTASGGYIGVYPNPAKQQIELHALLTGKQSFRLFGADGKLVYINTVTFYNNKASLSLPVLQRGIYVVDAGGIKSRLLIE
jgi:hypothetical protein